MTTHLNPLDILLESQQPDRPPPDFRWGVVHGTSPDLSVRLDRDPTAVIGSCCSLSYPLQAGDRVMVMVYDGRAVVFGRGGGDRPKNVWQNWTPVWTTTGSPITWGNSTRVGRYVHREDGTVSFTAKTVIGSSGFSPGSSHWVMQLPVPARVSEGQEYYVGLYVVGTSVVGGIGEAHGYGKIESGLNVDRSFVRLSNASATNYARIDASAGWAANNRIVVTGEYEGAILP